MTCSLTSRIDVAEHQFGQTITDPYCVWPHHRPAAVGALPEQYLRSISLPVSVLAARAAAAVGLFFLAMRALLFLAGAYIGSRVRTRATGL